MNDHTHRACEPRIRNLGAYAHWNCDQGEGSLAEGTNTLQDPAGGRILQGCSNGGRRNLISAPAESCRCLIRLLLNAGRLAVILAHTAAKNVRNLSTGAAAHTWTGTYIPPPQHTPGSAYRQSVSICIRTPSNAHRQSFTSTSSHLCFL